MKNSITEILDKGFKNFNSVRTVVIDLFRATKCSLFACYPKSFFASKVFRSCAEEGRGGVQNSSTSNHRHANVFCGKRAPQLVISTTSIGYQPK